MAQPPILNQAAMTNRPPVLMQPPVPGLAAPPAATSDSTAKTEYNKDINNCIEKCKGMATEEEKNEAIGDIIYTVVEGIAGDDLAPKITGMIIDLPYQNLVVSVQDYDKLCEKIKEGILLLGNEQ